VSPRKAAAAKQPIGNAEVPAGQKAIVNRWLQRVTDTVPQALRTFLESRGFSIRWGGGQNRVEGFADPDSGVKVITATGLPPCYIENGTYYQGGGSGATTPTQVRSTVSGFSGSFEQIVRLVCGGDYPAMERALTADFRNYRPEMWWFVAARSGDQVALASTEKAALQKVLRYDHDCTAELCRIHALDKGLAADRIGQSGLPFKRVRLTKTGEVVNPNWYAADVAEYDPLDKQAKAAEDKQKRQAIEREVEAFRDLLLREEGLRAG
jgi:hypothetical protein